MLQHSRDCIAKKKSCFSKSSRLSWLFKNYSTAFAPSQLLKTESFVSRHQSVIQRHTSMWWMYESDPLQVLQSKVPIWQTFESDNPSCISLWWICACDPLSRRRKAERSYKWITRKKKTEPASFMCLLSPTCQQQSHAGAAAEQTYCFTLKQQVDCKKYHVTFMSKPPIAKKKQQKTPYIYGTQKNMKRPGRFHLSAPSVLGRSRELLLLSCSAPATHINMKNQ